MSSRSCCCWPRLCVSFISHCLATRCLSLTGYVVDTAVCLACGLIGFRLMRVSQMVTCYGWINERADVYTWRRRKAAAGGAKPSESG